MHDFSIEKAFSSLLNTLITVSAHKQQCQVGGEEKKCIAFPQAKDAMNVARNAGMQRVAFATVRMVIVSRSVPLSSQEGLFKLIAIR